MLSKLFLVSLNADILLLGNYKAYALKLLIKKSVFKSNFISKFDISTMLEIFYSIPNHSTQNATETYLLVERRRRQ